MTTFGSFRDAHGRAFYGELLPDATVRPLRHAPWLGNEYDPELPPQPLADLLVAPPVAPGKLLAVGRNYPAHAAERGKPTPRSPLVWLKGPSSLLAHQGTVELPFPDHRVDFEAELGLVIGRPAKNVSVEQAPAHVFGYVAALDMTDRDVQEAEGQFYRAKSFDTFTPVGPYLYAAGGSGGGGGPEEAGGFALILDQNGERRQDGHTSQMIFSPAVLVSFLSQSTTLLPGDLILTGTPAGAGPVKDGDVLEVRIGPFAPLTVKVRNAPR